MGINEIRLDKLDHLATKMAGSLFLFMCLLDR